MTLRLSTKHSECATITDKDHNTLACISTNTPGLPEKLIERFNAFEDGGLVGELVEALHAYEEFEALLLMDDESWTGSHPFATDKLYDDFLRCQRKRNAAIDAIAKAKEATK